MERQTKRKLDHVFFKKCYLPDDFLDVMQQHPIFPSILYRPKLWLLPRPPRDNKHSRFFIHVLTDPLGILLMCHCIIVYLNVSTLQSKTKSCSLIFHKMQRNLIRKKDEYKCYIVIAFFGPYAVITLVCNI